MILNNYKRNNKKIKCKKNTEINCRVEHKINYLNKLPFMLPFLLDVFFVMYILIQSAFTPVLVVLKDEPSPFFPKNHINLYENIKLLRFH